MTMDPVTVQYPGGCVFQDFTHTFSDNKVTAILGPSGCGKTTLLFAIASAFGKTGQISFVFQEPRLVPWISLLNNIALVLDGTKKEKQERAYTFLEKVHLGSSANKLPREMSGGERQRVSIARAFSCKSSILLMDEPFQSQDISLKSRLVETFLDLQKTEQRTVIAVTHDVQEAVTIADDLLVLGGKPAHIVHQSTSPDLDPVHIAQVLNVQSQLFSSIQQG